MALDVKLNPAQGKPGSQVKIEVSTGDQEYETVRISVEGEFFSKLLTKKDDGDFTGSATVPYNAPRGTYTLHISAANGDQEEAQVTFEVV